MFCISLDVYRTRSDHLYSVYTYRKRQIRMNAAQYRKLNLIGLVCPEVVLRVSECAAACADGEVVEVESSDPVSVIDVPLFLKKAGHRLLESRSAGTIHCFVFEVRRATFAQAAGT